MTAPTLTKAETALIEHAQAVKTRALNITWPETAAKTIRTAVLDLEDALEKHSDLLNGTIHWSAYDWDLGSYAEPYEVALQLAAEAADEAAGYLIEVINRYCVAGDAARVSREGDGS